MRFERVDARAFGPFVARCLELAPGLNVVFGPNEAGKSSWHAALYAGLCGMRRARGQVADDRAFRDRHRPWTGERWEVGVVVQLADGRRVELRRDLDARTASVRDVDLGRDLAGEIMNDGAADGARWLGLDRDSFLATVCVRQAELALLHDDARALQDQLQRAAASARDTDTSAATAIAALREFRSEHVGQDRAGTRRPLRLARERHEAAQRKLEEATRRHDELDHAAQALEARKREERAAAEAESRLSAASAERRARAAEVAFERARALAERHPPGSAVPEPEDHARRARVIEAVAAFESLPETPQSGDETARGLRARLAALGSATDGDREVDPSVSRAARVFDAAQLSRERAGEARPERREQILTALRRRRAVRRSLVAAAALAALAALPLALDERWTAAGSALSVGLGAALVAALRSDTALSGAAARVEEELAHQARLDGEVERAARDLAEALAARAAPERDSVGESLLAYREACAERARDDETRRELERALGPSAQRELEQARRDAARAEAARCLTELAAACGVAASEPVALARELRAWHTARLAELPERERAIRERSELAALLDGRDLPELERLAARARAEADALGIAAPTDARSDEELASALAAARSAREAASTQRAELEARLTERRSALPSIAEAEEELARAEAERERVVELLTVLEQTESFLARAQDSAHRSIAPRLAEDLRAHLPLVTTGRWLDASVDPADLGVQLAGGDGVWRPVAQLSHGTREQVWLLLRIALARCLVRAGETSPLVLDDVTVHFDADRTSAALEALRAIARERQVVLFTQEAQVRDWAREHLRAPDDRLIELAPPPTV
jgi:uncharacterized protein YhaN